MCGHQAKAHDDLVAGCGPAERVPTAEEEYQKATINLIETVMAEGSKIPGGYRVDFTSNILRLVLPLPINTMLMMELDLPPERDYKILVPKSMGETHGP